MQYPIDMTVLADVLAALAAALVISFAVTPAVKFFAQRIGAIDVPKDNRRMHDHPIPLLGGLAVFIGFIISVLIFGKIDTQVRGMLLGCVVIIAAGIIDDISPLKYWAKLLFQIAAALIAVFHGIKIEVFSNPVFFAENQWLTLGFMSIPITVIWIAAVTNSVNYIDGLDGLSVGVSAISSVTLLIVALLVSEGNVAIIMAALAGACLGFIPYNLNPAKIFAGDTGSLLLGYVLATMSVIGLFKVYAVFSFFVPLLVLAIPLFDFVFAFFRRLLKGQNPMKGDKGHLHHRLINMGLNQKQAVSVLYSISAAFGVVAVLIASNGRMKAMLFIIAFLAAGMISLFVYRSNKKRHEAQAREECCNDAKTDCSEAAACEDKNTDTDKK
jgi:UDP-GlcNAc:undecaprenyl-phosphate GlcNAc-1-phosphate transferase